MKSKFSIFTFLISSFLFFSVQEKTNKLSPFQTDQTSPKTDAFTVLQNKCNTCHKKENPFKVFSEKNMNRWGPKIYTQVFVTKQMPKIGGTPLTEIEKEKLLLWLNSIGITETETN